MKVSYFWALSTALTRQVTSCDSNQPGWDLSKENQNDEQVEFEQNQNDNCFEENKDFPEDDDNQIPVDPTFDEHWGPKKGDVLWAALRK